LNNLRWPYKQNLLLQIDVDIGSSSVARSIIGLVLGYVTSIVVDLAILIEVLHNTLRVRTEAIACLYYFPYGSLIPNCITSKHLL
jgi:hypothetical protein